MAGSDRVGVRLPRELKDWAQGYARRNNTTVSALVVRFLTRLKQSEEQSDKQVDAEQV